MRLTGPVLLVASLTLGFGCSAAQAAESGSSAPTPSTTVTIPADTTDSGGLSPEEVQRQVARAEILRQQILATSDDMAAAMTKVEEAAKKAGVPEAQIKRYDTIDLAFQDLANGAVDAVVADGPPSVSYASKSNGKIATVGEPFTTEDYGIALQQGDAELLKAVNAALKELKANGTMQKLVEKWKLQTVAKLP